MMAGVMQQGYAPPEKADLSKASVRAGKTLTESKYSFLLEPYDQCGHVCARALLFKSF